MKKFADSIHKLNKYGEALNSKKQQRSDMLSNERLVGSNFVKMGTQAERYLLAPRLEEKPKNVGLNKRVRSSVAEIRVCILKYLEIYSLFSTYRIFCPIF